MDRHQITHHLSQHLYGPDADVEIAVNGSLTTLSGYLQRGPRVRTTISEDGTEFTVHTLGPRGSGRTSVFSAATVTEGQLYTHAAAADTDIRVTLMALR